MALSYKARRRWALIILLIGMPLYVLFAWGSIALVYANFERPPLWIEFAIYVVLGILWILPFKSVFKGVGQVDPDATQDDQV